MEMSHDKNIVEDKITKTLIGKETKKSKNQMIYMKNHYPRTLELLQKGLLLEMVEDGRIEKYSKDVLNDIKNGTLRETLIRKPKTVKS